MRIKLTALAYICSAGFAVADMPDVSFPSIDGGTLHLTNWHDRPVLVVNTASQCAYTGQYAELQALYDRYREDGLVVLAVPSDDFQQELDSAAEVKQFCEMAFGLDLPMTDITSVKGANAHPLYRHLKADVGFVPRWNFNKVLFDADGNVAAIWGANVSPMSTQVRRAVTQTLTR